MQIYIYIYICGWVGGCGCGCVCVPQGYAKMTSEVRKEKTLWARLFIYIRNAGLFLHAIIESVRGVIVLFVNVVNS